jgi:hypothetical protein
MSSLFPGVFAVRETYTLIADQGEKSGGAGAFTYPSCGGIAAWGC